MDADPSAKPPTWKKLCAAILSQTVEQLDDGKVFFLASLSRVAYGYLTTVYQMFANGTLKSQHVPQSKKAWDGQKAWQLRAINYTANLQDFSIVLINFCSLGDCNKDELKLEPVCFETFQNLYTGMQ